MAEARQLAEHCEDSRTQHCLLAEPEVAFDKVFEVHVAMESESAETNVKDLQARSQLPSNPLVNKLNTRATQNTCCRCGDKHKAADCHFKTAECHKCGKKGHISQVCKSMPKGQPHPQQKDGTSTRPTHIVKEEEDDYSMYSIR